MSFRRVGRRVLLWLYVATSLLGFLAEPTQSNAFAVAGYVVVVTGLTAFLHWVFTERTMCADRLVRVALAAAGLPMVLAAIFTVLGPAGPAVGVLLLALGGVAMLDQVADHPTTRPGEPGTAPDTRVLAAASPERRELAAMSISALLAHWRACGSDVCAVQLRADILDELERRDPAGVHRWVREGVAGSPGAYVRDDGLNA